MHEREPGGDLTAQTKAELFSTVFTGCSQLVKVKSATGRQWRRLRGHEELPYMSSTQGGFLASLGKTKSVSLLSITASRQGQSSGPCAPWSMVSRPVSQQKQNKAKPTQTKPYTCLERRLVSIWLDAVLQLDDRAGGLTFEFGLHHPEG